MLNRIRGTLNLADLAARAAWQAGLKVFPDSKELKERLAVKDDTQLYKQFVENESFRRSVSDMVYSLTSQ